MKKMSLIILAGLLFTLNSNAQSKEKNRDKIVQFKYGARGGVNFNQIKVEQSSNEPIQIDYERGMGFHFGATTQLQIFKLYIQPELLFSTMNHDVTLQDIRENGLREIGKQKFNKFEFPITAGVKFGNFKIGGGPVGTITLNSKSELLDKYEMKQKTSTWGYQFGAGFDFKRFNIEFRYEGNLSNFGSGVKIGNSVYDFDKRTSQVILSSAFYF